MTLITLIFTALLTVTLAVSMGQEQDNTIRNIEQKIQSIKQDTSYSIVTLVNEEFIDTGFLKQPSKGYGQLMGFFKNGIIYKICEHIGIKLLHDLATTEYYFSDGKLIFVYEKERNGPDIFIDSAGTVDHKTNIPSFEGCYYFDNDKLINTATTGEIKTMLLPNEKFFDSQSKEGQLLLSAQKYMNLLTKKKKE